MSSISSTKRTLKMSNSSAGAPLPIGTNNMNAFIAAQMQAYQQAMMQYSMMRWQPQPFPPQSQLQPPALQVLIPPFAYIHNYNQCYSPSQTSQQTPSPSLSNFRQSSAGSTSLDSPKNATAEAATEPRLASLERPGKDRAKKGKGSKKTKSPDDAEKRANGKALEVIDVDEMEDSGGAEAEDDAECKEVDASETERLRVMKSVLVPRHIQELRLIEELREKATGLKKRILRRFKMESLKKSNRTSKKYVVGRTSSVPSMASSKLDKEWKCTYPNCTSTTSRRPDFLRHITTHYPNAYFCPVCHSTFSRLDVLDRHLEHGFGVRAKAKQRRRHKEMLVRSRDSNATEKSDEKLDFGISCVESEEALRYEVGRDKERFNVYYLGVMEDYEMSEEHFEMLAGRRRGELDWAAE